MKIGVAACMVNFSSIVIAVLVTVGGTLVDVFVGTKTVAVGGNTVDVAVGATVVAKVGTPVLVGATVGSTVTSVGMGVAVFATIAVGVGVCTGVMNPSPNIMVKVAIVNSTRDQKMFLSILTSVN
jgi:uncharacterized protein (DUF2062 family)